MKSIKMIMGTAAVMSVLTIGAMSVSAQAAMPQKADRVETQKAAQSVMIDTKTESDAFSITASGSTEADKTVIELVSENDTPSKADNVETDKAAESVTIDPDTASDAYSISSAGNSEVSEDVCVLISDEDENIDITQLKVNVKHDRENNKFLISWDNGETWHEMDMPVVADALK